MDKLDLLNKEEKEKKINDPKYKKQLEARNIVQKILDLNIKEDQIKMIIQFLALELTDVEACREIYSLLKIEEKTEDLKTNKPEKKGSLIV